MLGLAAFGEASGYDLARLAASSVAHIWTPSQSQIYKTLPRLAARGLTRTREVEQRGRPDKAVYRITRKGSGALRRWLDEVEDEPTSGRVVFPLKLFFATLPLPAPLKPSWPPIAATSFVDSSATNNFAEATSGSRATFPAMCWDTGSSVSRRRLAGSRRPPLRSKR